MTLLSILQDVCNETGIASPSTVINNTDPTIRQLLALSNRSGKQLTNRFPWQELTTSATITTVALENQGAVDTLMPGFNWYLYQTMWNRNTRVQVLGPLFPSEWQFLKASNVTGPFPEFRIEGGNLLFIPIPVAGQIIGLDYMSRNWCQSSGNATQEKWAADTDAGILSEDMLTIDLIWRFKSAKGFEYAEDMRQAEIYINNAMGRSGARRKLNMSSNGADYMRSLRIPEGNWNL